MNQLCKVCAEPAAGFHFGAFTCEGCKSFFGRTYNNLSQIHDCKNGGQCVINKQNRTSCKACRLRKCLVVGMSKTGSRYGRRSNWFKIHCLLQEQCAYSTASQTPSFRSPVTPTLQDGSLPFVNCQLRDALHTMEGPPLGSGRDQSGSPTVRIPISSPSGGGATLPSCSVGGGGPVGGDLNITASFALGQMGAQADRRLLEETLNVLRRSAGLTGSELEAIRRSHCLQPPRPFEGPALQAMRSAVATSDQIRRMGAEFERVRRASVEHETSRLSAGLPFEWDRSHHHESSPAFSEAADPATKSPTPHLSKVSISVSNARELECPTSCSELKLECSSSNLEVICKTSKDEQSHTKTMPNRSPSRMTPKNQPEATRIQDEVETPMTEEERLSFLKTASKISTNNSVSRDSGPISSFQGIPNLVSHRPTSRDDILYSPINNNIFPFPSYPPVWHPLLPFSALAKFYPPFNTAPLPGSPLPFEGFPNPVFSPPELRASVLSSPVSETPKEDSNSKKRILDAILQVQRESTCRPRSPPGGLSPPRVSVALSLSQHVTSASSVVLPMVTSTATSTHLGDQPIDLTVRRKRKMAKSEILYQPGGGDREEEHIENEYERELMREEEDREAREEKHHHHHHQSPDDLLTEERMTKEILLKGTSEIVDLKTNLECATSLAEAKFEVPMKIMKLETSGDPLIA